MPRHADGHVVEVATGQAGEEIIGEAISESNGERKVVLFDFRRLPLPPLQLRHRLSMIERLLKREEADVVLVAGNVALVAFEIVEWPVAALTLAVHALARTRWKTLQALAEVAEEAE